MLVWSLVSWEAQRPSVVTSPASLRGVLLRVCDPHRWTQTVQLTRSNGCSVRVYALLFGRDQIRLWVTLAAQGHNVKGIQANCDGEGFSCGGESTFGEYLG